MGRDRSFSTIKLDNFENAETLVENYRRELEINRLRETLEYMLSEENESITQILNTAYSDYLLISTEMLPLIDTVLPSIKQLKEKIDSNITEVTEIVEDYSTDVYEKINNHYNFFVTKLEITLFNKCISEITNFRECLRNTWRLFNKDKKNNSLLSIRLIHYFVVRLIKITKSIENMQKLLSEKRINAKLELESNKYHSIYSELCCEFKSELKKYIIFAAKKLIFEKTGKLELEDYNQNSSLVFQCIFLLELKETLILQIKTFIYSEILDKFDFTAYKNDKLAFSNAINSIIGIIKQGSLSSLNNIFVYSLFDCEDDEYMKFMIDVYIRGVVLYILEHFEGHFEDQIITPTAPMDLYINQLYSLVSFIETNEEMLFNSKYSAPTDKSDGTKLKAQIIFKKNFTINNYSKKWRFGVYWNLIYRNILNRRMSIRNESVDFSKVYVYENKKYWLKYTVEIIRQIRWLLGTSSIQNNTPLPPSKYFVPLFTRCLYSSFSLLYDYSNYLLGFIEISSFSGKSDKTNTIWSLKTKPEHVCCIVIDYFSFEEWLQKNFIVELFFHISKVKNEFIFDEASLLSYSPDIINIEELESTVEDKLLKGYVNHNKDYLIRRLLNSMSEYLFAQTVKILESGLRAVPCLYRLTSTSISKSAETERMPSNYIENAVKPIESFLVFSINAIKSLNPDLASNTIGQITSFYRDLMHETILLILKNISEVCDKQIFSIKSQQASLQKLAQKNIDSSAANRIDPAIIASQFHMDIDLWFSKISMLLINFFTINHLCSKNEVEDYIKQIKDSTSYVELYRILKY
ncbi:hypothetical protein HWI79_1098 [Cryptosporidium felis]|nr:hypothetical protein HWI79_1098 [Cryptosporidium felis]